MAKKYGGRILWVGNGKDYYPIEIHRKKGEIFEIVGKWEKCLSLYRENLGQAIKFEDKLGLVKNKISLAGILIKKSELNESLELLKEASEECKILGNNYWLGSALGHLGVFYFRQGDYNQALHFYQEKLNLSLKIGDKKEISSALSQMGNCYYYLGDNEKAMEFYQNSLRFAQEIGDLKQEGIVLGNIGSVFGSKGEYAKALNYFEKRFKIGKKISDKSGVCHILGNMGKGYLYLEDYVKAEEIFKEQEKIAREMGDKFVLVFAISSLGRVKIYTGDLEKALELSEDALRLARQIREPYSILTLHGQIATIYEINNDLKRAEKYYRLATLRAEKIGVMENLAQNLYNLANILYQTKRFDEARDVNEKAFDIATRLGEPQASFACKVLKAKLDAVSNKDSAVAQLNSLFAECKHPYHVADLHYHIFNITNDKTHKEQALTLYKELFEKTRADKYKRRFDELNK